MREHQSIGNVPPIRRFELRTITAENPRGVRPTVADADPAGAMLAGATRRVSRQGHGVVRCRVVSSSVNRHLAGEEVVLVMDRRTRADPSPMVCSIRDPCPSSHAPAKQSCGDGPSNETSCRTPELKAPVERPTATGGVGHPEGGFVRERVLRRGELLRRCHETPSTPGAGRRRG